MSGIMMIFFRLFLILNTNVLFWDCVPVHFFYKMIDKLKVERAFCINWDFIKFSIRTKISDPVSVSSNGWQKKTKNKWNWRIQRLLLLLFSAIFRILTSFVWKFQKNWYILRAQLMSRSTHLHTFLLFQIYVNIFARITVDFNKYILF